MTTTPSVARVDLDPRDLLVDVNIRTDARLDKDFVASIKDFGVLVPVIAVRTASGDVRVRFGHRRTLAAIQADLGTVPIEIVGDEATDDAGQIERILTTKSLHRLGTADDPLTPEAHASCAGHVAWIAEEWVELHEDEESDDDEGPYELTYMVFHECSDPIAYGHVEPRSTAVRSSRNGTQISDEEAKAERQRVLRNNKSMACSRDRPS